jgi:hypothetical protein
MAAAIEKVLANGGKKAAPNWLHQFSIDQIADQTMKILKLS